MADISIEDRLARLERAVAGLEHFLSCFRDASLSVVDTIERGQGCTPRTAELRKRDRQEARFVVDKD